HLFIKELQLRRSDVETFAMIFAQAMFFNGLAMFTGRIAFIFMPAIVGKLNVKLSHEVIPIRLGENAGGSDCRKFFISLYDTLMRNVPIAVEAITIDQQ